MKKAFQEQPPKFCQFVGNKTKNEASMPDSVCEDDESIVNGECRTTRGDKEKAEVLIKYFPTVFTVEKSTVFTAEKTVCDKVVPNKTECKLLNIDISQDLVKKKLL